MKKATVLVALTLALPMAASGQEAVTQSLKGLHGITQQNIMATAEMLSEDLYSFQPTEEVRTMGGILAHIANAQYLFCSAAAGEASPNSANLEETLTTKADIVAGLQEAFAYCEGVYDAMTDAQGSEMREFFRKPDGRVRRAGLQLRPQLRALRQPGHLHAVERHHAAVLHVAFGFVEQHARSGPMACPGRISSGGSAPFLRRTISIGPARPPGSPGPSRYRARSCSAAPREGS